jgi:hypothetical protein
MLVGLLALTAGCYHATITTGRPASGQTIEVPWAHGFVYGLVPPATVEAASRCPNGVAQVETQHSFLNMLAQFLTFGLYTPMTITVQCAASSPVPDDDAVVRVPAGSSMADFAKALNEAAHRSLTDGESIMVRFDGLDR